MQDAGAAVDRLRRGEHLVWDGRGEDLARAGGVEHALADEAAVQRLVTGAPAGDERDLALDRRVLAQDELVLEVDPDEVGVRRAEAGERLLDDVFRVVEELLDGGSNDAHNALLPSRSSPARTSRPGPARSRPP